VKEREEGEEGSVLGGLLEIAESALDLSQGVLGIEDFGGILFLGECQVEPQCLVVGCQVNGLLQGRQTFLQLIRFKVSASEEQQNLRIVVLIELFHAALILFVPQKRNRYARACEKERREKRKKREREPF
jgi:hypothetical protein